MKLRLANPRGFCAGVDRAILIVERALTLLGPPIYVRHQVVHNRRVVESLEQKGAIFVREIEEVPDNQTVIFSAHGVSQAVRDAASARGLRVFDATCPLVTKVHLEVARYSRQCIECILIGHAGHPEVEGTMGQYDHPDGGIYLVENEDDVAALSLKDPSQCAYVTQTTLSVQDTQRIIKMLKAKFPDIHGPKNEDICYATTNRQNAVSALAKTCDVMVVVGSDNSSNSNRLRELAQRLGCPAYLVDSADKLERAWFKVDDVIGITAGASAHETHVQEVVQQFKAWGAQTVDEAEGVKEAIVFALPKDLR